VTESGFARAIASMSAMVFSGRVAGHTNTSGKFTMLQIGSKLVSGS
jgi:hypothetical protein